MYNYFCNPVEKSLLFIRIKIYELTLTAMPVRRTMFHENFQVLWSIKYVYIFIFLNCPFQRVLLATIYSAVHLFFKGFHIPKLKCTL